MYTYLSLVHLYEARVNLGPFCHRADTPKSIRMLSKRPCLHLWFVCVGIFEGKKYSNGLHKHSITHTTSTLYFVDVGNIEKCLSNQTVCV